MTGDGNKTKGQLADIAACVRAAGNLHKIL